MKHFKVPYGSNEETIKRILQELYRRNFIDYLDLQTAKILSQHLKQTIIITYNKLITLLPSRGGRSTSFEIILLSEALNNSNLQENQEVVCCEI